MVGSLLAFFSLTYAATWTFFLAAVLVSGPGTPAGPTPLGRFLVLVGTFAPAMVALGLTARSGGRPAVWTLLRRLVQWDVPGRWYVFAVSYVAVIKLTVAVLHRVTIGVWPRFGTESWYVIVAATVFSTVVGGQAGEEIGWRGYALPRLAARLGLGPAGVLLGLIWASWHLPLFFLPGADTFGQSFPVYLMQVSALSVAIAWLYAHTNGSLLLTMLMHSAVNQTSGIVPSGVPGATNVWGLSASPVGWLTLALLWVGAAYFLVRMPRAD
jgi:membrane protease YdiL (CAAX protease family)